MKFKFKFKHLLVGKKYVYYCPRLDEIVIVTRTPPTPDGKWDYTISIEYCDGYVSYPNHCLPEVIHLCLSGNAVDELRARFYMYREQGLHHVGEL